MDGLSTTLPPSTDEVTLETAAAILNVDKPVVRRWMDIGTLAYRETRGQRVSQRAAILALKARMDETQRCLAELANDLMEPDDG